MSFVRRAATAIVGTASAVALTIGLVDRVVEHTELLDEALALAVVFGDRAYGSIRAIKALTGVDWVSMRSEIVDWMRTLYQGQDLPEGVKAFFEKRPPRFNPDWTIAAGTPG